jgi:hypothetical protein
MRSLFKPNTLLIVGAGGSEEVDLPLGTELVEQIVNPAVPHDGADVTVRLSNGASAVRSVRACIGSRGRPMTNAELDRKFAAAAEGVLSKSKIDAYLASIRGVETLGDARVLAGGVHTA